MSNSFLKLTEKGATILEVSLVASLIGIVCLIGIMAAGGDTAGQFAIATCATSCTNGSANSSLVGPEQCAEKYYWIKSSCPTDYCDRSRAAKELLRRVADWCY